MGQQAVIKIAAAFDKIAKMTTAGYFPGWPTAAGGGDNTPVEAESSVLKIRFARSSRILYGRLKLLFIGNYGQLWAISRDLRDLSSSIDNFYLLSQVQIMVIINITQGQ